MSYESIRIKTELWDGIQGSPKTANPLHEAFSKLSKQQLTRDQGIRVCSGHGSVDRPVVIPNDPPVTTPPVKTSSSGSKTRDTQVGRIQVMADGVYKVHKRRRARVLGPVAAIPTEIFQF